MRDTGFYSSVVCAFLCIFPLSSELSHNEEQLHELRTYRQFLNAVTPVEWVQERASIKCQVQLTVALCALASTGFSLYCVLVCTYVHTYVVLISNLWRDQVNTQCPIGTVESPLHKTLLQIFLSGRISLTSHT